MRTIIGETSVPDGVNFPAAWPHKVLQAAVALRHKCAGAVTFDDVRDAMSVLLESAVGDLLRPERAYCDPFEVPESVRSDLDDLPIRGDWTPGHCARG